MENLFDLTGKIALVTGCNRSIGQGMALGLAEAGADIIGVSATLATDGGDTGRLVRALGRQFHAYQADFSQRASADAFAKQVLADFPHLDILVNNAGTIRRAPAAEHTDADWDEVLAINLDAPFRLARAVGAHAGPGQWQHHFYSLAAHVSGWHQRAGLRG